MRLTWPNSARTALRVRKGSSLGPLYHGSTVALLSRTAGLHCLRWSRCAHTANHHFAYAKKRWVSHVGGFQTSGLTVCRPKSGRQRRTAWHANVPELSGDENSRRRVRCHLLRLPAIVAVVFPGVHGCALMIHGGRPRFLEAWRGDRCCIECLRGRGRGPLQHPRGVFAFSSATSSLRIPASFA